MSSSNSSSKTREEPKLPLLTLVNPCASSVNGPKASLGQVTILEEQNSYKNGLAILNQLIQKC